jgi:hypothetical protein
MRSITARSAPRDHTVGVAQILVLHRDEQDIGLQALGHEIGSIRQQSMVVAVLEPVCRTAGLANRDPDEMALAGDPLALEHAVHGCGRNSRAGSAVTRSPPHEAEPLEYAPGRGRAVYVAPRFSSAGAWPRARRVRVTCAAGTPSSPRVPRSTRTVVPASSKAPSVRTA